MAKDTEDKERTWYGHPNDSLGIVKGYIITRRNTIASLIKRLADDVKYWKKGPMPEAVKKDREAKRALLKKLQR